MHKSILAVALAIASACGGGGGGGLEPPPPETVSVSIISPANGQTLEQSGWPDSPVEIRVSAVSSLRGVINNPTVKLDGSVIGNASVVNAAVSVGSHTIEACAKGVVNPKAEGCGTATFSVSAAPPIVVELWPPNLTSPVDCSVRRAYAWKGAVKDSANFTNVGSACRAEIKTRLIFEDSVMVEHDVIDSRNRQFYGQLRMVRKADLRAVQRCVCVRASYTNTEGLWAGTTLPFKLVEEAFAITEDLVGRKSSLLSRMEKEDGSVLYLLRAWDQFPIRVGAITESGKAISTDDFQVYSGFVAELEQEFGYPFQTVMNPQAEAGKLWRGGILITIFDTSSVPRGPSGGVQAATPDGKIEGGSVAFPNLQDLRTRFTVKHEIMHALDAGHTAAYFPSLMNWAQGVSPLYGVAVARDVMYLRASYEIRRMQWQVGAQCGLREADVWQRRALGQPTGSVIWTP
jgi:hypothetical protein